MFTTILGDDPLHFFDTIRILSIFDDSTRVVCADPLSYGQTRNVCGLFQGYCGSNPVLQGRLLPGGVVAPFDSREAEEAAAAKKAGHTWQGRVHRNG